MLSKTITFRLQDGSTVTKTVYGCNELILSKNINNLAKREHAVGYSIN
jgi:hypothetical protein